MKRIFTLIILVVIAVITIMAQDKPPAKTRQIVVENISSSRVGDRLLFRFGDGTPLVEISPDHLNQISNWVQLNWIKP